MSYVRPADGRYYDVMICMPAYEAHFNSWILVSLCPTVPEMLFILWQNTARLAAFVIILKTQLFSASL